MGITLLGFWLIPSLKETNEKNWQDKLQPLAAAVCLKNITDNFLHFLLSILDFFDFWLASLLF